MIGLFVLGILGLWLLFAAWLSNKLSSYLCRNNNAQTTTLAQKLTTALLALLFILLPFIDQLIAYPKWQQLCATTGDFDWGPGMNEEKAFGREVVATVERNRMTIFPNVKVAYSSYSFNDVGTGDVIIKRPHYIYTAEAFFYFPSGSGSKTALLLPTCATYGNSEVVTELIERLQLDVTNP